MIVRIGGKQYRANAESVLKSGASTFIVAYGGTADKDLWGQLVEALKHYESVHNGPMALSRVAEGRVKAGEDVDVVFNDVFIASMDAAHQKAQESAVQLRIAHTAWYQAAPKDENRRVIWPDNTTDIAARIKAAFN